MYLIRMKNGASELMRDGDKPTDPMVGVRTFEWSRFHNLPGGVPLEGNDAIEVHAYRTNEEAEAIIASRAAEIESLAADEAARAARVRAKIDAINKANQEAAEAEADEDASLEAPVGKVGLVDLEPELAAEVRRERLPLPEADDELDEEPEAPEPQPQPDPPKAKPKPKPKPKPKSRGRK